MNEVEAAAGDGAMLFTLPYMKNFENGSLNNMWDYTLLRGPLHSKTLKFTYGAGYGTKNDLWYRETSELEPDAMVAELRTQGMTGIYLDLDGYPEDEQQSTLAAPDRGRRLRPGGCHPQRKRAALLHPAGAGVTHETAKNNAKTMVLAAGLRGVRRVRLVVFKHCDLRARWAATMSLSTCRTTIILRTPRLARACWTTLAICGSSSACRTGGSGPSRRRRCAA